MLRIAICVDNKRTYNLMKKLCEYISDNEIKIYVFNTKDESINNFSEADYNKTFFVRENEAENIEWKMIDSNFINNSYLSDINPENVEYIKSEGVYTYIKYVNMDELFMVRRLIKEWQEDDRYINFIRINKKYLVNLKYIKKISKHTVLLGGESIVTKRGCIKEYNRKLKEYRIKKYKESIDKTRNI